MKHLLSFSVRGGCAIFEDFLKMGAQGAGKNIYEEIMVEIGN
jgi:hypothetical protein